MVSKSFNKVGDISRTQSTLRDENDVMRVFDALIDRGSDMSDDAHTALLIAQMAEKTFQLAKRAEELAQKHEGCVTYYNNLRMRDPQAAEAFIWDSYVSHADPRFATDANASAPLVKAGATWLAAQLYLNNELNSIMLDNPEQMPSLGPAYSGGFKRAAGALYLTAAVMLEKEGHTLGAERMQSVGHAILTYAVDKEQAAPMPGDCVRMLEKNLPDQNIIPGWSDAMQRLATQLPPTGKSAANYRPAP